MGELLLCGGDPFGRVPPAAPRPSAGPFPFGSASEERGPEKDGNGKRHSAFG